MEFQPPSEKVVIETKVKQSWTIHLVLWLMALSLAVIAGIELLSLWVWLQDNIDALT